MSEVPETELWKQDPSDSKDTQKGYPKVQHPVVCRVSPFWLKAIVKRDS